MFWRKRSTGDFSEEIQAHIDLEIERLREQGMSEEAAQAAAYRQFGSPRRARETFYESHRWMWWDHLVQDVRYGLRTLRKSPGFTIVAILTLALGIGANTAIFAFVNALYLKPLAVSHPEDLVRMYARGPSGGFGAGFSGPEFDFVRRRSSPFTSVSAETSIAQLHVVVSGDTAEIRGSFVSVNYFSLLGVQPVLGRAFASDEDAASGRGQVAVISADFWAAHFESNPGAIGSEIHINRVPFKIIGVAQAGFHGDVTGNPAELWIPVSMLQACGFGCPDASANCTIYETLVGRLAPARSLKSAQAELRAAMDWSASDWPERPSRREVALVSARGVGPAGRADSDAQMQLLMAVTACLLLIACANVAGLLLSRSAFRAKEIAVRLSIGASRWRITRQLITESLLLAIAAGGLGLWFSALAKSALLNFYAVDSEGFHHLYDLRFDWRVVTYSILIACAAAICFGLVPAIRSSRQDLVPELKEGGSSGHSASGWLRTGLVVAQIALCAVLIGSAVLLVRAGIAVERGTNFDPDRVALLRLRPELIQYTPQQVETLFRRVTQTLEAAQGIESVGFMEGGEGLVWHWDSGREVDVALPAQNQAASSVGLRVKSQDVSPNFFATLRIPLLQGRSFTENDSPHSPAVVIINATLARRLWPGESAVGRTLIARGQPYQVAGVAADIQPPSRFIGSAPHLYFAYWQTNPTDNGDLRLAIRVADDPDRALPALRRAIQSVDALVPIGEEMSLSDQLELDYMPLRLARTVMLYCGFLALTLSAMGIYSLLAFTVRSRTREIGIRIALGARQANVLRLIVWQCMKMVLAGVIIGFAAAASSARLLSSLLLGVAPADPVALALVVTLLAVVALTACYIPARRAMRVDPMVALRYE